MSTIKEKVQNAAWQKVQVIAILKESHLELNPATHFCGSIPTPCKRRPKISKKNKEEKESKEVSVINNFSLVNFFLKNFKTYNKAPPMLKKGQKLEFKNIHYNV